MKSWNDLLRKTLQNKNHLLYTILQKIAGKSRGRLKKIIKIMMNKTIAVVYNHNFPEMNY
jgi:hypothetical protein